MGCYLAIKMWVLLLTHSRQYTISKKNACVFAVFCRIHEWGKGGNDDCLVFLFLFHYAAASVVRFRDFCLKLLLMITKFWILFFESRSSGESLYFLLKIRYVTLIPSKLDLKSLGHFVPFFWDFWHWCFVFVID